MSNWVTATFGLAPRRLLILMILRVTQAGRLRWSSSIRFSTTRQTSIHRSGDKRIHRKGDKKINRKGPSAAEPQPKQILRRCAPQNDIRKYTGIGKSRAKHVVSNVEGMQR